jgi:hypothetical protein
MSPSFASEFSKSFSSSALLRESIESGREGEGRFVRVHSSVSR